MSRIGKRAVSVPTGVTVNLSGQNISVKGPKGELSQSFARLDDADDERIGGLFLLLAPALRLGPRLAARVQNVVSDLKCQSEILPITRELQKVAIGRPDGIPGGLFGFDDIVILLVAAEV